MRLAAWSGVALFSSASPFLCVPVQAQVTTVGRGLFSEWFCSPLSSVAAITYNGFYIEPIGQE